MGDFSSRQHETFMSNFMKLYNFKNLVTGFVKRGTLVKEELLIEEEELL